MTAQKILLESLNDLSSDELNQFKSFIELEESFPRILRGQLKVANTDETVDLMVKTFSGKCVNMTKTVLKKMNRTDLVQRLSDISSGTKEEPVPSLIQSVETMASVIELLLETLKDLTDQDLESFKRVLSQILSDKGYPHISPSWHVMRDRQDMVFSLVQDHSQHRLLEMTTEAFEKMNRTDLVQRLSQSSSGPKKKHSEAQRPAVIQKVATMAAVKHLLLETLNDLRNEDLEKFKQTLDLIVSKKKLSYFSWIWSSSAGRAQTVEQMMQIFGQQCVEITMEVLKDINRNDLRQRFTNLELKEMYSVDEHRPAQSEGAPIAAEKEILLKTLKDMSDHERYRFKCLLQFTYFQKSISSSFHGYPYQTGSALRVVDQMVETCGPQSVEVTREVLMDLDRTDLVERLSETILRLKDKHPSKPLKEEVTVASLEEKLLETLEDLSDGELEKFKRGLLIISNQRLETAGRVEIVDLMVEIYGQQSMEVTMEILEKMKEDDYGLEQKLSNITLGSKGPSRSLELEGSEKMMKDSSGWTKLEPEVNSTDEDEASTYSLKSEAGNFECSVSGLRWVCQEKVSFKYQFCSSEEPMKRMEMMKYMPAGPLIDITMISGKLFEVYLPHWICIDDIPKILQRFAVLHIDDCGDVVEKVSEVTSSHVKLSEPVFSPRAVLMKMGFPVKIHCNVLIYSKLDTSCILLHVYLTPLDPALKETMDKKKKHFKLIQKPRPNECLTLHQDFNLTGDITTAQIGPKTKDNKEYKFIQKPRPDEGLTLHKGFNLTAGITAEICPEKITLRYESQDPNFYEVYIENPDSNLHLTLSQLNKGKRKPLCEPLWSCVIRKGKRKPQCEPVWSCEIRKVDLRNSGDSDVKETGGQPSITGPWDMEATGGPSSENELRDTVGPSAGETAQYTMVDDKHPSKPLKEKVTVASLEEKLLETLEDLSDGELEKFKRGLQRISNQRLETAGRVEIVDLMVEIYDQQTMEVTTEILKKMKEDDYGLEQKLSNITLGSKGPSRSLELEGSEKMMKDSRGWTKLEPEVNSTDEDEASTYSLMSEAGNFECSVSGLRWVCQEKVSCKYQFRSSEEHMKRMEMMKYMLVGPLIDITVISGKLFEVYLPHWICIDDIPKVLQKFAVLHIDDCGDVVEKVSEVTSSHVKLSEPVFSPRAVLMKMVHLGIPPKIRCNVLIYSKAYESDTVLHVYLTPLDPALKEAIDKKKKHFKFIEKPRPDEGLTLHKGFNLTAGITAKIRPEKITLSNSSQSQRSIFFDVHFKNPISDFDLTLSQLNKGKRKPQCEPVWSCEILKVEHSSDEMQGVASITTTKERLLEMLEDLGQEEFNKFKWFLQYSDVLAGLPRISCSRLENSNILDLVDLMSQTYSQEYLEVTKKIFQKINRNDLVQKLSDIGSGSKAEG